MNRIRQWFTKDEGYSWKEYWIDGRGNGFMKGPFILLALAACLLVVIIVLAITVGG